MSNESETKTDWQKREVGALWKKESPSQKYFSGHVKIDDYGEEKLLKVVIFSNRHKSKDSHPDFRIYTVDDSFKKGESKPKSDSNAGDSSSSEPCLADEEVL